MNTKTGDYWNDLNNELHELLIKQKRYPTINQRRDMTVFLMHVLENGKGITEHDLKRRTGFAEKKYSSIKQYLVLAGLIYAEDGLGIMAANSNLVLIKPSENLTHMTRDAYNSIGMNCTYAKKEKMTIPDNAIITRRDTFEIITIPDKKENEDHPYKMGIQTYFNVAQTNEVETLLSKHGDSGVDLRNLFISWKKEKEYSLESVKRLVEVYLKPRNINCITRGIFPNLRLFKPT